MTKKQKELAIKAIKALKEELNNCDTEDAHGNADHILCTLLNNIGFADVVNAYEDIEKWYA